MRNFCLHNGDTIRLEHQDAATLNNMNKNAASPFSNVDSLIVGFSQACLGGKHYLCLCNKGVQEGKTGEIEKLPQE